MGTTGWIVIAIIVVVVVFLITIYNRLVAFNQRTGQAWSDISVQLKQRHDLVPNLVETVKGYAAHERGTLEAVVQARNAAVGASGKPRTCSPGRSASSSHSPNPIPTSRPTTIFATCRLSSPTSRTRSPPP